MKLVVIIIALVLQKSLNAHPNAHNDVLMSRNGAMMQEKKGPTSPALRKAPTKASPPSYRTLPCRGERRVVNKIVPRKNPINRGRRQQILLRRPHLEDLTNDSFYDLTETGNDIGNDRYMEDNLEESYIARPSGALNHKFAVEGIPPISIYPVDDLYFSEEDSEDDLSKGHFNELSDEEPIRPKIVLARSPHMEFYKYYDQVQ